MKQYKVKVTNTISGTIWVEAESPDDARLQAILEADCAYWETTEAEIEDMKEILTNE